MSGNTNIEIKHIIVPFDFSTASQNALQHAIAIAKNTRADITLLSVMDSYSSQALQHRSGKFADFEEMAFEKLDEYAKQVLTFNKIESKVSETKWSRAVAELANHRSGALLVLGVGGKNRDGFFDASHAYRIVDSLNVPLLAVRENQQVSNYKTIITPLDEDQHSREKLPYVTLLASAFDAKVSVIGLQTHGGQESTTHMQAIMNQASHYIQMKVKQYQDKLISSKNEVGDIVKHASEEKADLLVIMSAHEKSLANLFSSPYAQQVSDKSTTPVLICPTRVSMVMGNVSI